MRKLIRGRKMVALGRQWGTHLVRLTCESSGSSSCASGSRSSGGSGGELDFRSLCWILLERYYEKKMSSENNPLA